MSPEARTICRGIRLAAARYLREALRRIEQLPARHRRKRPGWIRNRYVEGRLGTWR